MENNIIKEICCDEELSNNVLKKLNEQRKSEKNCDYTLKTENGESFRVHKCVLEPVSSFFETMFNFESEDKGKDSVVLKRCSSVVLEKIIDFMYTGEVVITSDIAKSTLDTALFLGLNTLVDTCTQILIRAANCENCFELLAYSETYFCGEALANKCVQIIAKNIETLKNSSQFDEISFDSMKLLCSCDRSLCNDEQLYLAIVKWIKFDMENREQYISVLLNHIQFEEISLEFGVQKILKDNSFWKNQDYISKVMGVISENWTQQLNIRGSQKVIGPFRPINLYVVIGDKVLFYNTKTNLFSSVMTQLINNRELFGYSTFGEKNFLVCGGRINNEITDSCTYFSLQENCWKSLPPMEIRRWYHRAITLNNKVYVCGGFQETSVEIFDINKSKWMRGPSFNREIDSIGLCLYKDNIYGVDESNLQFLDTRTDKWIVLPSVSSISKNPIFMFSAANYKDYIYGFAIEKVVTFDIRANKWLNDVTMYEKSFDRYFNLPKSCTIDNEIYVCARLNKDDKFMLNTYKASNLSESICHMMELDRDGSICRASFSL